MDFGHDNDNDFAHDNFLDYLESFFARLLQKLSLCWLHNLISMF